MNNNYSIRPQTLNDFIGKNDLVHNLKILINSANIKLTSLDHILFYGLPGTGKTTLASIIANEMNKKIKIIQGTHLKKNVDLINLVSLISEGDIIFIDEIQAVSLECMETLYSIMEDFCIDVIVGKDNDSKPIRLSLPRFTLIAATTSIGYLPKPLEERFGISFFIDAYEDEEIFKILEHNAKKLNLNLSLEDVQVIANHCKGIPRIANKILKRVVDFLVVDKNLTIDEILNKMQIYELGLIKIDLLYMKALYDAGANIGLKSISSITQFDQKTIENTIEPFLLRNNLIQKNSNGRCLTQKGEQFIKKNMVNL